jgi:hypothetical protein
VTSGVENRPGDDHPIGPFHSGRLPSNELIAKRAGRKPATLSVSPVQNRGSFRVPTHP